MNFLASETSPRVGVQLHYFSMVLASDYSIIKPNYSLSLLLTSYLLIPSIALKLRQPSYARLHFCSQRTAVASEGQLSFAILWHLLFTRNRLSKIDILPNSHKHMKSINMALSVCPLFYPPIFLDNRKTRIKNLFSQMFVLSPFLIPSTLISFVLGRSQCASCSETFQKTPDGQTALTAHHYDMHASRYVLTLRVYLFFTFFNVSNPLFIIS